MVTYMRLCVITYVLEKSQYWLSIQFSYHLKACTARFYGEGWFSKKTIKTAVVFILLSKSS